MKETILNIPPPKNKTFIVWEHAMKSAVAFIGTFAMLFFGPMLLEARSRDTSTDSLGAQLVFYLIDHPEVQFGLSILAVVICNVYLIWRNRKMKYIVGITKDDNVLELQLTNLYYSKTTPIQVDLTNVEIKLESKVSSSNEKKQRIFFRRKNDTAIIGEMDLRYLFWSENLPQLKFMLQELEAYRVK